MDFAQNDVRGRIVGLDLDGVFKLDDPGNKLAGLLELERPLDIFLSRPIGDGRQC